MFDNNFSNQPTEYPVHLDQLLEETAQLEASDLHLAVGVAPRVRIGGQLVPLDYPVFSPRSLEELLQTIMNPDQVKAFEENLELDTSYAIPGVARYRCNVMKQRGSLAAVFRVVPFKVPNLDKLGLPPQVKELCYLARGLVLVTGPTASGKSTTLAAMIDLINRERTLNVVTIEDPIEFLHRHNQSVVKQREVGLDTHSFANALRHVLRHDPDVILIGEMRDVESISIALTAAETGHLVFSTLHTQTAPLTINRIVDVFEDHKRNQVRQQLSNSFRGIIAQQLIPTRDGSSRVPAVEYMTDTSAVRNLIREGKEHQLYTAIQTSGSKGMQTMDQALVDLYVSGKVSKEIVLERCVDREELERLIKKSQTGFSF